MKPPITHNIVGEMLAIHHANNVYVIVIEIRGNLYSIVKDPGMDRPWSTSNKKLADDTAVDFKLKHPEVVKSAAMTINEAFSFLRQKMQDQHRN